MTTARRQFVTVTFDPLPAILSKKKVKFAWQYKEAFEQVKSDAYFTFRDMFGRQRPPYWDGDVLLTITWTARHPRHIPDDDNAIRRVAPILDAGEMYGLYKNDKQVKIQPVIGIVDKGQPKVELRFEPVAGAPEEAL